MAPAIPNEWPSATATVSGRGIRGPGRFFAAMPRPLDAQPADACSSQTAPGGDRDGQDDLRTGKRAGGARPLEVGGRCATRARAEARRHQPPGSKGQHLADKNPPGTGMRRVRMAARDEMVAALVERYAEGSRNERSLILDEFVAVTKFHRKHATRLLKGGSRRCPSGPRLGRRIYNDAAREALIVLWEASDRICGKRLRPLIPLMLEAMERHKHLQLTSEVRTGLLAMSAATMDRALRKAKGQPGGKNHRRAPPSAAVRRSVPVRTFSDWGDPAPGFIEADLVAHGGPTAAGSFIQTLVLTDIATGWVECAPLLYREQKLLTEVLNEVRKLLPFPMLGFDTDSDTVFMNETVRDYCRDAAIMFTRCRPYQKNDQA